ncbi:hypothetical protein NKR23_g7909 [Pleurostoma richardsiae]|uniref:Glucan 1, 4-alpha-glucosidase n=1 Tax=Pleurostoma richardsiae TaxID=41990 RepID=A0AA38RAQ8_9PEZI|nr:hypothetical protein NKR23_g7909 [Pleurostoma richardsiae]
MDDPWGSPWATADGDKDHSSSRAHSPTKHAELDLDLAPPKPAFLTVANSTGLSTQSPWAEDNSDGFGDWASASPGNSSANNSTVWGAWAGDSGSNASHQLTPTPRDEGHGRGGPIAWPGSAATSPAPGFKPLSRKPSTLSRSSADDPWATEPSFNPSETPGLAELPPLPSTTIAQKAPDKSHDAATGLGLLDVAVVADSLHEEEKHMPSLSPTHAGDTEVTPTIQIVTDEVRRTSTENASPTQPGSIASAAQSTASRRSSRSSVDSHRENDERQDSPITSVDEEAKNRPQVSRKSSSKVQELVDMFDGLAKKPAALEPVLVKRERSQSRARASDAGEEADVGQGPAGGSEEDEDADFGDFEDPLSRRPSKQPSESVSPERSLTPKQPFIEPTPPPHPEKETPSSPLGLQDEHQRPVASSHIDTLVAKFGPIKFNVILSDVDKLYDAQKLKSLPPVSTAERDDVSDRILFDSFTTISERKTWYRISRQGSARKHNAGDDENYRRVAWPSSEVRAETIKIVRRWMEEDSISGRPTLGGSAGKGNAFGWDSTAEPVALEQVFGRRRASAHSRNTSVQSVGSIPSPLMPPPRRGSVKVQSPTQAHAQSPRAQAPVAQFGWSTAPGEKAFPLSPPLASPGAALSRPVPGPSASQLGVASPMVTKPRAVGDSRPKAPMKPLAPAPIITALVPNPPAAADDDDDEWGEMVMSPPDDKPNGAFSLMSPATPSAPPSAGLNNIGDLFASPSPKAPLATSPSTFNSQRNIITSTAGFQPSQSDIKPTTAAPAPSSDPWDFSFFDSSTPSVPLPQPIKTLTPPSLPAAITTLTPSSNSLPTAPKLTVQTPTSKSAQGLATGTDLNMEQANLARDIIDRLPDLSYMMR